jgi:hypothetical protein
MTDQGPLGRPPRGASVPGGAPRGAGPQLMVLGEGGVMSDPSSFCPNPPRRLRRGAVNNRSDH